MDLLKLSEALGTGVRYTKGTVHIMVSRKFICWKISSGIHFRYILMLDGASEGNIKTKTPEEAKRLIDNLVFCNSTKNACTLRNWLQRMVTRSLKPILVLYMKSYWRNML